MAWTTTAHGRHEPLSPQEGFTLVEVVVATVILIIILVPTAYLLSSSTSLITTNRSKTVAVNLASSQLEEDRDVVDAETWTTGPLAPTLPAVTASQTVGQTVYKMSQSVGWCAENGTVGPWGTYSTKPTNPAGYGVLVTVTWQGGSVSEGTVLMTPNAQLSNVPTSSTGCPL